MSQVTRGNAEKKELIKSCVMELLKEDAFIKEITGKVIAAVEKHFNKKFEDYEKRTSDLVHKNQLLVDKCDSLEQYSRRNNIRIIGADAVPHSECEKLVMNVLNEKLQLDVSIDTIDRCHPVGPKKDNNKRDILVKFTSYRYRRAVMDRRKLLKGTHISIVEDLTRSRYLCYREANKVFGFRNVWVMDGVIHIKKDNRKLAVTKFSEVSEIKS
ncbi:l1 transposable element-related [Holotrichia oblita]|uniref:L1 transposable element-related n=2 Tax=Holotrichia oblita TaxID=644536 RepID=A0ACB9TUN9_HOLOL|nr:l1 transposable element-related [Holotrichia oblita]KAI4470350.1 l1 transposable element-related [Holotrichia oblita]